MSAFIVSEGTMHRAIFAVQQSGDWRECEINTPEQINALGCRLYQLNADAVNARYNDLEQAPTYRWRGRVYPLAEAYKALGCLIYQCCEGDVPNSKLYQALERAETALGKKIIRSLKEYNAAPYDAVEA